MNESPNGILSLLPRELLPEGPRRYWDFYNMRPGAGFYQKEFGFYALEKW